MIVLLLSLFVLMAEVALATFTAARAWNYRPARLFVLIAITVIGVVMGNLLRGHTNDPTTGYLILAGMVFSILAYNLVLIQLSSALFMPQWWEGSRPIIWISLPYLLVGLALAVDMVGDLGLFVAGVRLEDGIYRMNLGAYAPVMFALSLVGALVNIILLTVAFVQNRSSRLVSGLFALSLTVTIFFTTLSPENSEAAQIIALIQVLPTTGVLAYGVIGTRLFTPTRAAFDLALQAMSEAVAVLDRDGQIIYVNPSAATLGLQPNQQLDAGLTATGADATGIARLFEYATAPNSVTAQTLTMGNRLISVTVTPVVDIHGRGQGTLLLGRDITEIEQRTVLLEQERRNLEVAVQQLEAEQRERARLAATVQALSLPLIPVLDGVLVLPLVGAFDTARANEFAEVMLRGIEREQARLVLIDITGVPLLDTAGAAGLLHGVQAAALLGARCVLVGVRPEIAQALVALGTPLNGLATAATLQQALLAQLKATALAGNGHPNGRPLPATHV